MNTSNIVDPSLEEIKSTSKAAKTEVISFKVTPEQKSLIIDKAVTENGLTLPEFILYKLFKEEPENLNYLPIEPIKDVLPDEEREALETLVKQQRSALADLAQQLYELKASKIDLSKGSELKLDDSSKMILESFTNEAGKKWLREKSGLFGGQYETDLSKMSENDFLNVLLNVIKFLKDDEPGYFRKAFHSKAETYLSFKQEVNTRNP